MIRSAALALVALAGTAAADPDDYLVDHPGHRWWLSGQVNVIAQMQPGFRSPYSGDNSFLPDDHAAVSLVGTAFGGFEITPTTALVFVGESAGGGGLSDALGMAGFTNLDVVRNPSLGATPYVARLFVDQIIPLSEETDPDHERDALHVFRRMPAKRIEIRAGKFSTADVFDTNAVGSDSHLQFMNWTVDNNGAWDYAADTRGYTVGVTIELAMPLWAVRFGELLMPTVANGIDLDLDIPHARGENLELEAHTCAEGYAGRFRLLLWWNHANMGSYAEADAMPMPDITATREEGRSKVGVGLNVEQELPHGMRGFARAGWNDGRNESFAYTEVDNTFALGADLRGTAWGRPDDKVGLAVVTNGISEGHRRYLARGGLGFLLGDGRLSYGREDIVEAYYTARAYRGVSPAADVQLVTHPGYNTDRGPVFVGSLRLHVEI